MSALGFAYWLFIGCSLLCNGYDHNSWRGGITVPFGIAGEDREYWNRVNNRELHNALPPLNNNTARNVIVFIGTGMDANTVTATRIYKVTEPGRLSFEHFPHIGLLKTYSADKQVPDTAAAATALFTGAKTKNGVVGLDATVVPNECVMSMSQTNRIRSIFQWAQETGRDTGFVTTSRITEPVTAALYASSASHRWECDAKMPEQTFCKDIARQLVEDFPGRNLRVILGGGRQTLVTNSASTTEDKADIHACSRVDNRNLIQQWISDKQSMIGINYKYVENAEGLSMLDTWNTDYLLGVFANSRMAYESDRSYLFRHQPSLMNMTDKALSVLRRARNGFFLVVESGLINVAHHDGNARAAIEETAHFDDTIQRTMDTLLRHDLINNTLVIVTGTHGHTMSINGYPNRGNRILGIAGKSKYDGTPYTTLTYATGRNHKYNYEKQGTRRDPAHDDLESSDYRQQIGILTDEEINSGSDIPVYAKGPKSHFFHSVHEQTFVAYVISYAANIGPYRINAAVTASACVTLFLLPFVLLFFYNNRM